MTNKQKYTIEYKKLLEKAQLVQTMNQRYIELVSSSTPPSFLKKIKEHIQDVDSLILKIKGLGMPQ